VVGLFGVVERIEVRPLALNFEVIAIDRTLGSWLRLTGILVGAAFAIGGYGCAQDSTNVANGNRDGTTVASISK
jgi:hypothetical protein